MKVFPKCVFLLTFLASTIVANVEEKPSAPVVTEPQTKEPEVKPADTPDHVLILNAETFPSTISGNEMVLVEFFAPWCSHCKALEPEYQSAANTLAQSGSKIKLAKVDGTIEQTLSTQYDIVGYPTIKLFRNGSVIDYNGGRTAADILAWLEKKSSPTVAQISSKNDADVLINANNVSVLVFAVDPESPQLKTINTVADLYDDISFGVVADPTIFPNYDVQPDGGIILFKKFDEGKSIFSGNASDVTAVKEFLSVNSTPLITELNEKSSQKIFDSELKVFLLLFVSKAAEGLSKIVEPAKDIAKAYRGKLLFISVDADDDSNQQMMTFFGADSEDVPCMRIIRIEPEMEKFKPETNELTPDAIKHFIEEFLSGKLHPIRDEFHEDDWNLDPEPVKTLVAANFDEIVFDTHKDVLVLFYSPTCDVCHDLAPIYEQLGEAYGGYGSLVIAKIDGVENPLEHVPVPEFPTIRLFTKYDNHAIDYHGDRSLRDLILFVEENHREVGHFEDDHVTDHYGGYDDYDDEPRYRDEL